MYISLTPVASVFSILGRLSDYPDRFCTTLYNITSEDIPEIDTTGTITIPPEVQMIHMGAFEGTNLKSIVIPKSVLWIRRYAFKNCTKLERVEFEEGSEIQFCDPGAFIGCTNIKEFKVPSKKKDLFKNLTI